MLRAHKNIQQISPPTKSGECPKRSVKEEVSFGKTNANEYGGTEMGFVTFRLITCIRHSSTYMYSL